jgi:hypothetical protein
MEDDLFKRMGFVFGPEPIEEIEKICKDAGLRKKESGIYEHGKNVTSDEGFVTEYEKDCFKCANFYTEPLMCPSGKCNLHKVFCGSGFTCDKFEVISKKPKTFEEYIDEERPTLYEVYALRCKKAVEWDINKFIFKHEGSFYLVEWKKKGTAFEFWSDPEMIELL